MNYPKIFNSIDNSRWRIWKTIDENNIARQNKFQITSPQKLKKFVEQAKNPQLYVSISTFLNPHKNHGNLRNQKIQKDDHYFYPRAGYLTADNILLDSYFFIDLDSEKDIMIAHNDAVRIIEHLKVYSKVELHSIQFSGNRGIHLIYKHKKRHIKDPEKRIKYYINQKKILSNKIRRLKLETMDDTHYKIMEDIYRVYAAPYSKKRRGGTVTPLNLPDFYHRFMTKVSEAKADDKKVATEERSSTQKYRVEEGAGLTSPLIFYYLDILVNGLKNNYVTVIKKNKKRFKMENLQRLQHDYNLSDFYIFQMSEYVYAVNTKIVQFPRLIKILRSIKSENISFILSKSHYPIPLSSVVNKEGIVHKLTNLGILKSKYGQGDVHSLPHSKVFGLEYDNMVGKDDNVYQMRYKGGEVI